MRARYAHAHAEYGKPSGPTAEPRKFVSSAPIVSLWGVSFSIVHWAKSVMHPRKRMGVFGTDLLV